MMLKVAYTLFGLAPYIGARFGRGIDSLPPYDPIHVGCLLYWHRDAPDRRRSRTYSLSCRLRA